MQGCFIKSFRFIFSTSLLFVAGTAAQADNPIKLAEPFQNTPATNDTYTLFPGMSRIYLEGSLSYGSLLKDDDTLSKNTFIEIGEGEAIFPIYVDTRTLFYLDTDIKAGKKGALFSAGTGYRQIEGKQIYGAYLFGDYNKSAGDSRFWVVNPGIELLTATWDTHINGYVPVGKRRHRINDLSAEQLGLTPEVFFVGHTEFTNRIYQVEEEIGYGIDGQIGYTFPRMNQLRSFMGGYAYSLKHNDNIAGVQGGVEYQVNPFIKLGLQDSYDNIAHNTLSLSIQFIFGDVPEKTPVLQDRMLDTVSRHLGTLNTGGGIPSATFLDPTNTGTIVERNIWFFNTLGVPFTAANGLNNCTFEQPCNQLSQSVINGINTLATNALFFFAPGSYNNPSVGTGFTLFNGQQFFGRMDNFTQPAVGANRALINDTLFLPGNNIINSLQVNGNTISGTSNIGIEVLSSATGSIKFTNTAITSQISNMPGINAIGLNVLSSNAIVNVDLTSITAISNNSAAALGIVVNSNTQFSMSQSAVIASGQGNTDGVFGIRLLNNSAATISESFIQLSEQSASGDVSVFGVVASGTNTVAVSNSAITLNVQNISANSLVDGFDIGVNNTLNLNTSSISITANNGARFVTGINTFGQVNVSRSNILINATNAGALNGNFGIDTGSSATTTINNSNISVNAAGDNSTGLNDNLGGTTIYQGNIISADASGGGTARATNGVGFTNQGGNVCTENGVSVACP